MSQARGDSLADGLSLTLILGIVVGERIQNEDLNEKRTNSDHFQDFKSTKVGYEWK
jgi:hypothetical protein